MSLSSNIIGDTGAAALASAAALDAFGLTRFVVLERNLIGDMGVRALAGAIRRDGAFPEVVGRPNRVGRICLKSNPGDTAALSRAIDERRAKNLLP